MTFAEQLGNKLRLCVFFLFLHKTSAIDGEDISGKDDIGSWLFPWPAEKRKRKRSNVLRIRTSDGFCVFLV